MLEAGRDIPVGERSDTEGACAGCVEAIRAVLLGEAEHAEARTIAVLGMSPLGEQALGKALGVDADAGGPAEDALGCPLGVLPVCEGHVCGDRRMPPLHAAPRMNGLTASQPEDLDGGGGSAEPQLFAPEPMWSGVEVAIERHVVVDAESDALPVGVLVRRG